MKKKYSYISLIREVSREVTGIIEVSHEHVSKQVTPGAGSFLQEYYNSPIA